MPFAQTDPLPDPRLLVPHQVDEVIKLIDLIQEGDLVTFVVSDVGMGKTALCKFLSEVLPLERSDVLTVFVPAQSIETPEQMVRLLLNRLEIEFQRGDLVEEFERFYRWHQSYPDLRLVVFVDEFPELDVRVAEMIRVLADLRNVNWVLNGQKDRVLKYLEKNVPSLLNRRRYMLEMKPLNLDEVRDLLALRIAWAKGTDLTHGALSIAPFTLPAIKKIYKLSGGIPREALKIASDAVYSAIERGVSIITPKLVSGPRSGKGSKRKSKRAGKSRQRFLRFFGRK